jgi:hypothetical protein
MRVSKMQNLVYKKKPLSPPKKHAMRYKLEERSETIIRKPTRSQEDNMRRTNKNITRIKSWTNKGISRTCPQTHPNPQEKESRNPSNLTKAS